MEDSEKVQLADLLIQGNEKGNKPKQSTTEAVATATQDTCPSKHRGKRATVQMALSGSKHFNLSQRKTKSG